MATREGDPYTKTQVVLLRNSSDFLPWYRSWQAKSIERDFDPTQFDFAENRKVRDYVPADQGGEAAPTYAEWDRRDRKLAGALLDTITCKLLQDHAFNEYRRIAELPADHEDAWQKSHLHAFIIRKLREECVKSAFNDKRMTEHAIVTAAKSFNGDFELYHKDMSLAVNAALRVGVELSDNIMKAHFNNNFESKDQDWMMWKLVALEGIDRKSFSEIMQSGLAHDSNRKLKNMFSSPIGVAVNYGEPGHYTHQHGHFEDRRDAQPRNSQSVTLPVARSNSKGGKGGKGRGKGKGGGKGRGGGHGRGRGYGGGHGRGRGYNSGKGGKDYSDRRPNSTSTSGRGLGNSQRICDYCHKNGHTAGYCYKKRDDERGERSGAGASGTTIASNFVFCQDVGVVSPLFCLLSSLFSLYGLFVTVTLSLILSYFMALSWTTASTTSISIFMAYAHKSSNIRTPARTHATKKKHILCKAGLGTDDWNTTIYDNGSTQNVINNPNLFLDGKDTDKIVIHGIAGKVTCTQAGWGCIFLKALDGNGEPTKLKLLSKSTDGPADTIFVPQAPINLISGNFIKKMGFDFINKTGSMPYLFHPHLKAKVILFESRGLLLLPIDDDLQRSSQCRIDSIFGEDK